MTNLEINRESNGDEILLKCTGRLDANQTGHLNDYIDRLVREGLYQISLDMTGIEYLSSAGIRSLVTQYKNLKAINGNFHIAAMSENVRQVLNMVGMVEMLGYFQRVIFDARDLFVHHAHFGMEHDIAQALRPVFKLLGLVGVVIERTIRQAGAQHALVTGDDNGAAIVMAHV